MLLSVLLLPCMAALATGFGWHSSSGACAKNRPCPPRPGALSSPLPPDLPATPDKLAAVPPDELLPSETAKARNDAIAFIKGPISVARPFHFTGSLEDRHRAVECLAAVQLYEAGRDPDGQRAVAQVVINRLRHPAFPHTICGVVFQGAERTTGCQFTFTCDGSLRRTYPQDAWDQARKLADRMLDGATDPRVGWATHYHTDWVFPYWSASLDKLSGVGHHLFLRWRGTWGGGPAFSSPYSGNEPLISRLPSMNPPVSKDAMLQVAADAVIGMDDAMSGMERAHLPPMPDAPLPPGMTVRELRGNSLKLVHPDGGAYGLLLRRNGTTREWHAVAESLCRDLPICRVMGWIAPNQLPRGFPIPPQSRNSAIFRFMRDQNGTNSPVNASENPALE